MSGKGEAAMRSSAFGLLAVVFGVFLAVSPLPAHHSFSAEYDSKKPVTLKGIVTKVEWMNPHVYFYLDVKDDSGTTSPTGPWKWGRRTDWSAAAGRATP